MDRDFKLPVLRVTIERGTFEMRAPDLHTAKQRLRHVIGLRTDLLERLTWKQARVAYYEDPGPPEQDDDEDEPA